MSNRRISALVLGLLLLVIVGDRAVRAAMSTVPWPTGTQLNKNGTTYYKLTATSTAQTQAVERCKSILIKNSGDQGAIVNLQGGTPTATTNGMLITAGSSLSDDLTTISIAYISETVTSTALWVQVDY